MCGQERRHIAPVVEGRRREIGGISFDEDALAGELVGEVAHFLRRLERNNAGETDVASLLHSGLRRSSGAGEGVANERRAGVFGQDAEGIFLGIPNVNDDAELLRGLQV